ncbi:NAD(P)H-binding protein [soil metagenome]
MKVAITGGTGFVGRHLATTLTEQGHEVVIISRGIDNRDLAARSLPNSIFAAIGTSDVESLTAAFKDCDAVAHLAGINREIGEQTYENVHVKGTQNVVDAAKSAGIKKILLLSFLRARPNCGSPYHESKWEAEEIVRASGIPYSIFKAGVIYGKGDHLLDHLSHALHTFPIFPLVGLKPTAMRPLAVEDLAQIMIETIVNDRMHNATFPLTGPEEIDLRIVAQRVGDAIGRHPWIFLCPLFVHKLLAFVFERTMKVPLESVAQVKILSESLVEPTEAPDQLPANLQPKTPFSQAQIRAGLPKPSRFGVKDCLWSKAKA